MKPTCIILHGLPGSGKTTLANKLVKIAPSLIHIDYDNIRTFINNGVYKFDPFWETDVREVGALLAKKNVLERKSIIVNDALAFNCYRSRIVFIDTIRNFVNKVYYLYLSTSVEVCKERREAENIGISAESIDAIDRAYEPVTGTELGTCIEWKNTFTVDKQGRHLLINDGEKFYTDILI